MKKNIFIICSDIEDNHLLKLDERKIKNQIAKIFYLLKNNEYEDEISIISSNLPRAIEIAQIASDGLENTFKTSKFLQSETESLNELSVIELINSIMSEVVLIITHQNYIQSLVLHIARYHGLTLSYDVILKETQMISFKLGRDKEIIIY